MAPFSEYNFTVLFNVGHNAMMTREKAFWPVYLSVEPLGLTATVLLVSPALAAFASGRHCRADALTVAESQAS